MKLPEQKGFIHNVIILAALVVLIIVGFVFLKSARDSPKTKILSTQKLQTETRDNLKIDRKLTTAEISFASQKKTYTQSVEVIIANTTDEPLKNVRFVERIPKQIAKSIEEVTFSVQPTAILNKDPDVLWEFGEIKPQGAMKIVYETWKKATGQEEQPKVDELVKALVETMAEEKPKVDQIPQESKDYTSIASLLKKVAIEKKTDEVVDKEFLVHGVVIQPYKIPALQQFLGSLFVKAAQLALDAFMPGEVVSEPVQEALGQFKDAGIESAYNFVTKDLHIILGDLPLENEVEMDGGKVPPIFTLYNWPIAKTPELEPGHVFAGKVKLVKLLNGTVHLQILPGFKYEDPSGYVSLYELSSDLGKHKGKEVTTIGRVTTIEEKEGIPWVKITLDGYRPPSAKQDKIFGYSLWASLPKDFSPIPKNNQVLTLSGVIKEAKFDRPIEYKGDNRFYLEVGAVSQMTAQTTSLPKARIVDDKKVYLGDTLLLDASEFYCSGIENILYAPTNDYFLVIVGCIEGDNLLFLFRADGGDKKQITGKLDVVNYQEVEWAADGKSFTYHRINGFGYDKKTLERIGVKDAPPEGMVRYDITTGEKTLVGSYKPSTSQSGTPTSTISPETGSAKIITVAEFEKLPEGCLEKSQKVYLMTVTIEEDWGEAFTGKNYKAKDDTGSTTVSIHQRSLQVGKRYQLKGCKAGIYGDEKSAGWPIFEVWDDQWPDAIIEK